MSEPGWFGDTYVIDWLSAPRARTHKFVASCQRQPGWRYKCPAYDAQARSDAESSLRAFLSEHAEMVHWAPAGTEMAP